MRGRRLRLEGLEDRVMLTGTPSIYVVNSSGNGNSGTGNTGTLPYVVGQANSDPNTAGSEIQFDPTVFDAGSLNTIALAATLDLNETAGPEVIDGPGPGVVAVSGGGNVEVFNVGSNVTASLIGLTITGGSASSGGGVANHGNLTIVDSILMNNTAGAGGAVFNLGTLTVISSTLEANRASQGFGGAIANAGTLSILDSTLTDNSASEGGGAISSASSATLTSVTIAANSTSSDGGGIYEAAGTLETVNATIANNSAGPLGSGGGIELGGGTAALYNTIVAKNQRGPTGSIVASDIASGSLGTVSGSFNLIGTGGSGGIMGGVDGNQVGEANPRLGPLASNGGPTATMALLTGSPAIDKASDSINGVVIPTLDQRGAERGPRAVNAGSLPDVGAYEASSSYLVTSTDDSFDLGTLRTGVGWANVSTNANPQEVASPLPNTLFFDGAGVFATSQTITLSPQLGTLNLSNSVIPIEIFAEPSLRAELSISGGNQTEVFNVSAGVTATFANFTITDGFVRGLIVKRGSVSDLDQRGGGAISNAGKLTLGNIVLENNSAGSGGAIFNSGGSLSLIDCSIENNQAVAGGGIFVASGVVTLGGTTLLYNAASVRGGAIQNDGTLSLLDDKFDGNSASDFGGQSAMAAS